MATVYKRFLRTGGAPTALDAVDGASLADGDMAYVTVAGVVYTYLLDDDLGGSESDPDIITPNSNAGDKRWVLQNPLLTAKAYTSATGPATAGGIWRASDGILGLWTGNGTASYALLPFINVKDHGAAGDGVTDDATAIQAAITDVAVKGGVVFFPPGTYAVGSPFTLSSNVMLLGAGSGASVLDFTSYAVAGSTYCITATGTTGAANNLTGNVAKGALILPVTDGSAFAAGDWLLLSSGGYYDTDVDANAKIGEICRVQSVAVNNVTVSWPLFAAYTTADTGTAKKLTMVENVTIQGLTIERGEQHTAGSWVLSFDTCYRVTLRDVVVRHGTTSCVFFRNTVAAKVFGGGVEESWYTDTVTSYGYSIADACMFIEIIGAHGRRGRHCVMVGKTASPGIPRFVKVTGGTYETYNEATETVPLDAHYVSEYVEFEGATVHGGNGYGIQLRGKYGSAIGNTVHSPGGILVGAEVSAGHIVRARYNSVKDNTIYQGASALSTYYHGIYARGNHTDVIGNTIYRDDATQVNACGIYVNHVEANYQVTAPNIVNNKVYMENAVAGAAYGIRLNAALYGKVHGNIAFYKGNAQAVILLDNGTAVNNYVSIRDNTLIDNQDTPTMASGISVGANSTNITHGENVIVGNTGVATNIGAAASLADNILSIDQAGLRSYENPVKIGAAYVWTDVASGILYTKTSLPANATDGTVIGDQT